MPRNKDGFFVTADRAEEDGKGRFILRGRADDVVKIGGKRVDLAEIQEKIRNIKGIYDALVLMLPRAKGRQADLAVLVATDLEPGAVRQKMNGLIEPYAMPRRIVVVDKIPVTPTGKYDRREIEGLLKPGR